MRRDWTKKEVNDLIRMYPTTSWDVLEIYFDRGQESISHKAVRLGLNRDIATWDKPTEPLTLEGFDLGFVIGMIEGEGTIGLYTSPSQSTRFVPVIQVVNTQWDLLWDVRRRLNDWGEIKSHGRVVGNRKQSYTYQIRLYSQVEAVLKVLEPYLISKRRQAQLVLEALELDRSTRRIRLSDENNNTIGCKISKPNQQRQQEIADEMRDLNRRGINP